MTTKRHETEPFAADTILFLNDTPDDLEQNNEPSSFEEELVPADDKKGRTKWIR